MSASLEIKDDIAHSFLSGNASQAKIQLCDQHWDEQRIELQKSGSLTEAAVLRTSHILTSIAIKALGSTTVVDFRCPVCALQEFDYIANVCDAYTSAASNPA